MAASLVRGNTNRPHDGLQPLRLSRDLYQVAELIEIGFQGRLDTQGHASIREMKAMARLGPLLWIVSFFNMLGLGHETGFVWRDNGRVVGNVSLYRAGSHPFLRRGWMIANVAVLPEYRRQGIARELMHATLQKAESMRGEWVCLQVESHNLGAINLYDEVGFQRFERLEQWNLTNFHGHVFTESTPVNMRLRRMNEIEAEADLIFNRARVGGMAWTTPIERSDLIDLPFASLGGLPEGRQKERWILENDSNQFLASIWVEATSFRRAKITVFPDPSVDERLLADFLASVLNRTTMRGRAIRLETTAGITAIDNLLRKIGFHRTRTFYQMRKRL